jgi:hypothetical protein
MSEADGASLIREFQEHFFRNGFGFESPDGPAFG